MGCLSLAVQTNKQTKAARGIVQEWGKTAKEELVSSVGLKHFCDVHYLMEHTVSTKGSRIIRILKCMFCVHAR